MRGIKLRLVLSLSVGFLAIGFFYQELRKVEEKAEASTVMSSVLRAKKFIKAGRQLTPELFEEVPIPARYIEPSAIRKKAGLINKDNKHYLRARIGIRKGEQLVPSKLVDDRVFIGLAWTLPQGVRALTLRLEPEEAVGGWLRPGDWVQVFGTWGKQSEIHDSQSLLILPRTQVLAVQDQAWDSMMPSSPKNFSKSLAPESVMVTIGVSSQEAARVTLAAKKGDLTMVLLSPTDESIKKLKPYRIRDLK